MGKALMIRDVDFSANKLDTVNLEYDIPCVSVTLSDNAYSADKLLVTKTLTATPSPYNTTDTLLWSTSNNSIATVANGVVTVVGVGTCTITATCGNATATCTITSAPSYTSSDLYRINGYGVVVNSASESNNAAKLISSGVAFNFSADGNVTGGYNCIVSSALSGVDALYGIPVPKNATSVTLIAPDASQSKLNGVYGYLFDSKTKETSVSGVEAAKLVGTFSSTTSTFQYTMTFDLTPYTGIVDSMILWYRVAASSINPETLTDSITITYA